MASQDTCVTIVPYFKVASENLAAIKELCVKAVAQAKEEVGCLYYGFLFCDDEMFCREGYVNAEAALEHSGNIAPILGEMLKLSDIIRLEVHGIDSELEKLRGPFTEMNPRYFVLESGFRK